MCRGAHSQSVDWLRAIILTHLYLAVNKVSLWTEVSMRLNSVQLRGSCDATGFHDGRYGGEATQAGPVTLQPRIV
jgi:hypothetical protein